MGGTSTVALVVAAATAMASAGLMVPVLALLRATGNLDVPNHRSSHVTATPRGAGLALIPALLVGSAVAASLGTPPTWGAVVGALTLATVGVGDDFFGLSAAIRLAVQLVVGMAMVLAVGADWNPLLLATAVVVVVGYVNAFNFMDGINGISGFHAVVVGAAYAALAIQSEQPAAAVLGAMLLGMGLGFLPWNVPVARAFLGDSGSYLLGALIAGTAIFALGAGMSPMSVLAPMWIYVVDTVAVIARRLVTRQPLMEAHREHVYQRLAVGLGSHPRTALLVAGFSALPPLLILMSVPLLVTILLSLVLAVVYLLLPVAVARVSA